MNYHASYLAGSGLVPPRGQQPETRPRGGQCPDMRTSTASKRHTARGCIAMSSSTVPCTHMGHGVGLACEALPFHASFRSRFTLGSSRNIHCLGNNACSSREWCGSFDHAHDIRGKEVEQAGTLLSVPELTFLAGAVALGKRAGAELDRTTQRPLSAAHSMDMPPKLSGATASRAERPTPKVSTLPVPPAAQEQGTSGHHFHEAETAWYRDRGEDDWHNIGALLQG